MRYPLRIFEPDKNSLISKDSLVLVVLIALLTLLLYLESTSYFDFGIVLEIIMISTLAYVSIYYFSRFFLYEKNPGRFNGSLILKKETISIGKTDFPLNEIKNIEIHAKDYKGKYINSHAEFSRKRSNGVSNEIILSLINNKKAQCYFFQTKGVRIKNTKQLLISYYLQNKISWLHLLNILEIEDYDEIQSFKKRLGQSNE